MIYSGPIVLVKLLKVLNEVVYPLCIKKLGVVSTP